ncbi:exocyst complex component 3-like protein 4 [Phascolarctos cinereus]|nr:exocyst complex component 3-like protein 4 isoform X2 [Phascolarctos cinereus]XP_020826844.1 exocyst complex component 3-like protein 4 isoform X2 [Phascolarctos cinereus]XP_020826845.1 exocyst complex component 3-like protein 4 isoform X2 [Phascolarctos cinereus]XP_020826846.1 exocyst complex component 3-like protein 4 isoform X2 [Phascolarctos cinereus]XP_020826847.1 exocyst complex component 3-like protein 4 isoform X2 [Phascolarctos cinereus]XP_020826848.1 exocyst complex component 3-li
MGDQKQEQRSSPGKDSLTQNCGQKIDESSNLSPRKEKNDHLGLGNFKRALSWKIKPDVESGDHVVEKRTVLRSSRSLLNSFRKVVEKEADRSQKPSSGPQMRQQVSSETEALKEEESEADSFNKTPPARTGDSQREKQRTPSKLCSPTQNQRGRKLSADSTSSCPGKEDDSVLGLANFKRAFLRMSKREGSPGGQEAEESGSRRKSSRFLRPFRKNEEEVTNRLPRLLKGSQGSSEEEPLEIKMEVEEEKPVSDLIAERQLLKAFSQLYQREASLVEDQHSGRFKDDVTAYARQAMDICVHYDVMAAEIRNIVGETLSQPSVDSEALLGMAQLIEKEEEVHPGGLSDSDILSAPRKWRLLWKEAVKKSALDEVGKVGQGMSEPSLASLLANLGRVVKKDLVKIRREVQPCYPEDFPVWKTYVDAFHGAVSARLQELLQEAQGFEQLYVVMDWVANVYCSKDFLGSLDLELDVTTMPKLLAPEVWEKLESDYTKFLETKINSCFDSILKLELDRWAEREGPALLQGLYHSPISIDIHMLVGEHVNTARAISLGLEATTLQILEQSLNEFIPRFEEKFLDSDTAKDQTLFLPYLCAYITAFQELKTNLPAKFLSSFKNVETTLSEVISGFKKQMLIHLHRETQVLFRDVGSKAWVTSDKLHPIMEKTVTFAQHLKHLVQPHSQECLQEIHCYVIREYVAHVLRPRERLRGADRVASAQKMSQEADAIDSTFHSLGSEASWLGLVIPCISDILGETYKEDIRKHIETLIKGYPDIRQEHVAAILALRKLGRRRNQLLLRHAQALLKKAPKTLPGQGLFEEIDVPASVEVLLTCI